MCRGKKIIPPVLCEEFIFLPQNQLCMLYFLIKKGNELHVMRVHPKDEVLFRLFYDQQILVEGDSVQDVLRQFDELPLVINDGF